MPAQPGPRVDQLAQRDATPGNILTAGALTAPDPLAVPGFYDVPATPTTKGLVPLQFGGDTVQTGQYFTIGSEAAIATGSSVLPSNECVIPVTGIIKLITWNKQDFLTSASTVSIVPWIDGVAQTALSEPFNPQTGTVTVSIAVSAGEKFRLEMDVLSGVNWFDSVVTAYLEPTSGNAHGRLFSGLHSTLGWFLPYNCDPTVRTVQTNTALVKCMVSEACDLTALSWNSATGSASSELDLYVNNSFNSTIALTGAFGLITGLSVALAQGDTISFKGNVQVLGSFNAYVVFDTIETTSFGFAGAHSSTAGFYANYGDAVDVVPVTTFLNHVVGHVTPNCKVIGFTLFSGNSEREVGFEIYKNGIAIYGFRGTSLGSSGVMLKTFTTPLGFLAGDVLSIASVAPLTTLGSSHVTIEAHVTL